tara:strand:- start:48 stop:479 length:432 start_codon:yes stop_codon:yes gene_type:complete
MTCLRHSGIVVQDVEKSIIFYCDYLGFDVIDDRCEGGEYLETILGLPGACARTVKIRGSDSGMIELLEFRNPRIGTAGQTVGLMGPGPTHVALTVDNIDKLYLELLEKGIEFITSPKTSPDGKVKLAFCRDPDGVYLELVQEM